MAAAYPDPGRTDVRLARMTERPARVPERLARPGGCLSPQH
jgi:hypothetical protein